MKIIVNILGKKTSTIITIDDEKKKELIERIITSFSINFMTSIIELSIGVIIKIARSINIIDEGELKMNGNLSLNFMMICLKVI